MRHLKYLKFRDCKLIVLREKIAMRLICKHLLEYVILKRCLKAIVIPPKSAKKHRVVQFRRAKKMDLNNLEPVIYERPLSAHWSHTIASTCRAASTVPIRQIYSRCNLTPTQRSPLGFRSKVKSKHKHDTMSSHHRKNAGSRPPTPDFLRTILAKKR